MIPRVCALALIAVILLSLLGELGFKSRKLFAALCTVIVLSFLTEPLAELLSRLGALSETAGITEAASCALKAVGLGYIFGFTSDVCLSLGEGGIASAVQLVGRVQIFLVAWPFFEKAIALGTELLR